MSAHVSTARMNEALDGLLASAEIEQVEAHVAQCAECRNEYARLSEVVVAVRALPTSASPPEGVWEAISDRISSGRGRDTGSEQAEDVVVVPFPAPFEPPARRTIALTVRQLGAAAAIVALVSATTVWVAADRRTQEFPLAATSSEPLAGAAARAVSVEDNRYVEVVEQLEQILLEGRAVLAPATLLTIEESLRTVDEAIADIEEALGADPNSDLLLRMLATHRSTKLGVLQRAATAVQAQI